MHSNSQIVPSSNKIDLNNITANSLPYIKIKNPPLKLLIDTGCNISILRPYFAEHYYPNTIFKHTTPIRTCAGSRIAEYKAQFNAFPEFNTDCKFNFVLFTFHNYFDGIIGMETLKQINANLDLLNHKLTTKHTSLPIYYRNDLKTYKIEVPPNSSIIYNFELPLENQNIWVPKVEINNGPLYINECVTSIKNGIAKIEINNPTSETVLESLTSSIPTEKFETNFIESHSDKIITKTQKIPADIEKIIRTEHMNSEEKQKILKICFQYKDIFHTPDAKLTSTSYFKHKIRTTDEEPVYTKTYRHPHIHKIEIEKQINELLDNNIIRPSTSPWCAPVWIVPKKPDSSGKLKWRMVVDYRRLNEKTITDRYPIPNIEELLDKLGKCTYFSTLDLNSGFHQVQVDPSSIHKTAFSVERGHYEFLRMPFGLKNAPSTFQRLMDEILKGYINNICLVYMDDIIIFGTSLEEHLQNIKLIFQRLRDTNLKVQVDKCEFLRKEIDFLGHLVTQEGIKPNPKKLKAITNYPLPKTTKQIKSFLGITGFYRKFIKNYAHIAKPLTNCLKKGNKIQHTEEFLNAFNTLKSLLTNPPILAYPDFEKPFLLTTDASNYALGAVLSQKGVTGEKPVSYISRTLNDTEQKYSTIEKELLAIVWSCKMFRPYLFGTHFTIRTDHRPLKWLMNIKEPSSKLTRWRLKLEEYDYDIEYIKGKCNQVADGLSRAEINLLEETLPEDDTNSLLVNIDENNSEDDISTIHSDEENPIQEIRISDGKLNSYKNQIILRKDPTHTKVLVTKYKVFGKNRIQITIPDNTQLENSIIHVIKNHFVPKETYAIFFKNEELKPIFNNILRKTFSNRTFKITQVSVVLEDIDDEEKQTQAIQYHHETKTNHRGIQETYAALSKKFYWPNMLTKITSYINTCPTCNKSKYERHPYHIQYSPTPIGNKPFDHIYIDTFTIEGTKFLTILDSFSKIGQAYHLTSPNAIEISTKLLTYFGHYSTPRKITCDQGTEFKNQLVEEFCKTHNIELHFTTIYNPNSNSPVERFHSTLVEHLTILRLTNKEKSYSKLMPYALYAYNSSIHSSTDFTPFQILLGRETDNQLTEREIVTEFVHEHSKNLNTLFQHINAQLANKQQQRLQKLNKTRETPPQVQEEERYIKAHPRRKGDPKFKNILITSNSNPVKVSTANKSQHKRELRRTRKK